jgi:alginate O-acetyltransferase complex protein AlgI
MYFDTLHYLGFLALVVALHPLAAGSARRQNALLVVAGLVFYGWHAWPLCGLLLAYAVIGYGGARWIHAMPETAPRRRRWALRLVVGALLAGLAVCKYVGFFRDVAATALDGVGLPGGVPFVDFLLPIGLSFYCFQQIAYVVDVYRGVNEPERDAVTFFAFACFFPVLLAGPIERGRALLPQLRASRSAGRADVHAALWLLVWGYYLKVVVADSVGGYVDLALDPTPHTTGWTVVTGLVGYTLQVYCDFCGYSLIAKGSAALLGLRVVWNFDRPYWSTSIGELWRRWHVSLSTWLRDYLFLPLGGASHGEARAYLHLVVTMTLAGIWHGAGWTFALWGAAQGVALAVHRGWVRHARGLTVPAAMGWLLTMGFWTASMLLFRVPTLDTVAALLAHCDRWTWTPFVGAAWTTMLVVALPVFLVEAHQARRNDLLAPARWPFVPFSLAGAALLVAIYARFWGTAQTFIYFQF